MATTRAPRKRTYGEGCAAAHALDLIGERWALLVVRELLLGPKRFTDLRDGLPGASSNVLAGRLRELGRVGVLSRRRLPPPAASEVYELTGWGHELEPVVIALGRWSARSPSRPLGDRMSANALILSLKTTFDGRAAGDLGATYELRLAEDVFCAEVTGGRFVVSRGEANRPDATIWTNPDTLAALVYANLGLDDALGSGDARIGGSREVVESFLASFPMPDRARDAAVA